MNACRKLESGTLDSVIELCERRRRSIAIHRSPRGDFLGLSTHSLDGFMIEFAVDPIDFEMRPKSGWNFAMVRKLAIQSISVHDLRNVETLTDEQFQSKFK